MRGRQCQADSLGDMSPIGQPPYFKKIDNAVF